MSITQSYSVFYPKNKVSLSNEERERMRSAIEFIEQFDPLTVSDIELEYIVMHTAFLICPENVFVNNYNVDPRRQKVFLDHMSLVFTSDINAWCQKLYELGFWRWENFATVNLLWNWLNRTLANPTPFL